MYLQTPIPSRHVPDSHKLDLVKPEAKVTVVVGTDSFDRSQVTIPLSNVISIHWYDDGEPEPF